MEQVAEMIGVSHREAIGTLGKLINEIDSRHRMTRGDAQAPATYPLIAETLETALADVRAEMATGGDVDAALTVVAVDAIYAIAAIDKEHARADQG